MKHFFPATLDGFGAAIAFKRLHPDSKIILKGDKLPIFRDFSQSKEVTFEEGSPFPLNCEAEKCLSCTANFVLKMKKNNVIPKLEDARLFAFAIHSKTLALTHKGTTAYDVEALYFCFKHGGRLSGLPMRFYFQQEGSLIASEIMTKKVRTLSLNLELKEVMNVIRRTGFTGFPVVNERDQVIGVITKKDVERALKSGINDLQMIMSIPPIIVHQKDSIEKIGEIMTLHDIGRVIIVDENMRVIGIITRRDLVRAIAVATGGAEFTVNISNLFRSVVRPDVLSLLREMGDFASSKNETIYVVGGFVRDILLGKWSNDVDVVIEGDGVSFSNEFALKKGVECRVHPEFKTATLFFDGISIDVATARTEYYEMPGALPKVEVSNLRKDLYRRDFTINAMAVSMNSENFGTLVDFFGGRRDLEMGRIRILHSMSFIEDPTRILRALRYVARFEYNLDEKTESLLISAINRGYLKAVSPARIRNEFEKALNEKKRAKVFELFQKYNVLEVFPCKQHVDFKRYFELVDATKGKFDVLYSLLLLVLKPCNSVLIREIMKNYGVPKRFIDVFNKIYNEEFRNDILKSDKLSTLYFALSKIPLEAMPVLAYDKEMEKNVFTYLERLRNVRLEKINGKILKVEYGLEGLKIGEVLRELMKLKIDDGIDEMEAIKKILKFGGQLK